MRVKPPSRPGSAGKSMVVAYMTLAILGEFGGHRFYLGKPWTGGLMACLSLLPVLALPATVMSGSLDGMPGQGSGLLGHALGDGLAYAPTAVVLAWMLVDAFLLPGWVRETGYLAEADAAAGIPAPRR